METIPGLTQGSGHSVDKTHPVSLEPVVRDKGNKKAVPQCSSHSGPSLPFPRTARPQIITHSTHICPPDSEQQCDTQPGSRTHGLLLVLRFRVFSRRTVSLVHREAVW